MLNTEAQRQAFVKLFADEEDPEAAATKWLEENADKRNRTIKDSKMVARSTQQEPSDADQDNQPDQDNPDDQDRAMDDEGSDEGDGSSTDIAIDDSAVEAIAAKVAEMMGSQLSELSATVAAIADKVGATASTTEELEEETKEQSAQIEHILSRLGVLEEDDEKKRQRWLADLPASQTTKPLNVTYRPRTNQDTEPADAKPKVKRSAEDVLSKIPVNY